MSRAVAPTGKSRRLPVVLAIALLALPLAAGCAGTPSPILEETAAIEAGSFLEVNLAMDANASIEATYRANGTLQWDVHSHEEGSVRVHDQGAARQATIPFQAPGSGTYSLLLENPTGTPIGVEVTVSGQASLESVTGFAP